jgi:hypothetical protein
MSRRRGSNKVSTAYRSMYAYIESLKGRSRKSIALEMECSVRMINKYVNMWLVNHEYYKEILKSHAYLLPDGVFKQSFWLDEI